ncbi:Guanine nucleotide exchange factor synembryn [Rhizoctonia solani]|uniref:Guanine nucleotide exchange factor synembryn n=1 Tax=Rhizoctonia solani TaxID=456999 RepID=A0A8H7IHE5_9AGAM|nr:Guanine nucleotide exchange factor synembryn [Rhizoctonia solani]
MSLLTDYRASASPTVLANITNASIGAFNDQDRATLIQLIIDDVVAARNGQGRIASKDIALALGAIKSLGRLESGSRVVASEKNLSHFLDIAKDLSSNAEASKQAMRCIANAILLVPAGRETLVDLDGDEFCTRVYINEASSPEFIFLASRLLFFMAHTDGSFISRVVRQHRLPNLLAQQIESLGQSDAPFAKDALTDILKLHFSAVAKYSRLVGHESGPGLVLGEYWDDVFEPWNLTYAIHALLNVPVAPFAHLWFPQSPKPSRSSSSGTQSPRPSLDKNGSPLEAHGSGSGSGNGSPLSLPPLPTGDSAIRALSILQNLLALHLPGNCDPDDAGVRAAAKSKGVSLDEVGAPIAALVTRLAAGDDGARTRMAAVVLPPDMDRSSPLEKKDDFLGRCIRLMTSVYYPTLKDAIGELLFVLCGSDVYFGWGFRRKSVAGDLGCKGYESLRFGALDWALLRQKIRNPVDGLHILLLPPPDSRHILIISFAFSFCFVHLLIVISQSFRQALSAAIGYGNAAGHLYNKGIMAPPPASSGGDDINPITGTREAPSGPSLSEMTDEEKQREAEKLFVLFDRMERYGYGQESD